MELAEALSRVIPFAAKGDDRPVLACVRFAQKDGKLTLTSADGFRLAEVSLDFEDGEGEALISAKELRGLTTALRKAKRVNLSFEDGGERLDSKHLVIDTELIERDGMLVLEYKVQGKSPLLVLQPLSDTVALIRRVFKNRDGAVQSVMVDGQEHIQLWGSLYAK